MSEENLKKGKIAEKIVEQMFREAGFKVIHSGYEKTFSELADQYSLIQGPAAQYIRHHPDFIVVNSNNEAFLIEVKYRRFGIIDQKAMFNYPATQVILLTKDSMHCQSLKEIHKNGKKFIPLKYLRPFSDIPVKIREKYIKKTRRLLGDENIIGQIIEKSVEKIVGKKFMQEFTPGQIKFSYIDNEKYSYEKFGKKEIITDYSSHGKTWDSNEIRMLLELYKTGKSINDISSLLHRQRNAVIFRLVKEKVLSMQQAISLTQEIHPKKSKPRRYYHPKRRHRHHRKR